MKLLSSPAVLAVLGICIVLHILSCLLHAKAAKVLSYINILLHTVLVVVSAFSALPIEEAVLVYLISLFAYTVSATAVSSVRARKLKKAKEAFEAREESAV